MSLTTERRSSRRDEILQALARMLQAAPGSRITTASLAREVGVSEAALYRHFPSKTRMFEGLLTYTEDQLFTQIHTLLAPRPVDSAQACGQILQCLLEFVVANPGIARILTGDALTGESDRLHQRVIQLFDRIETQLRQLLQGEERSLRANLLLAAAEGRISQYVRSEFERSPLLEWPSQWALLRSALWD